MATARAATAFALESARAVAAVAGIKKSAGSLAAATVYGTLPAPDAAASASAAGLALVLAGSVAGMAGLPWQNLLAGTVAGMTIALVDSAAMTTPAVARMGAGAIAGTALQLALPAAVAGKAGAVVIDGADEVLCPSGKPALVAPGAPAVAAASEQHVEETHCSAPRCEFRKSMNDVSSERDDGKLVSCR